MVIYKDKLDYQELLHIWLQQSISEITLVFFDILHDYFLLENLDWDPTWWLLRWWPCRWAGCRCRLPCWNEWVLLAVTLKSLDDPDKKMQPCEEFFHRRRDFYSWSALNQPKDQHQLKISCWTDNTTLLFLFLTVQICWHAHRTNTFLPQWLQKFVRSPVPLCTFL